MRILHTSDLHGDIVRLRRALKEDYDLWVDTGDFFPNRTRGHRPSEEAFQPKWFNVHKVAENVKELLGDRPCVVMPGNHDYVDLAALLRAHEVNAQNLDTAPYVDLLGLRFAGFREIPFIAGEWAGEATDLYDVISRAFDQNPDILVTHSPPGGILDLSFRRERYGITQLSSMLGYAEHKIQVHLFGHVHESFGTTEEYGIRFYNAARGHHVVTVN